MKCDWRQKEGLTSYWGILWQAEQNCWWKGMASFFCIIASKSALFSGTETFCCTSKLGKTYTLGLELFVTSGFFSILKNSVQNTQMRNKWKLRTKCCAKNIFIFRTRQFLLTMDTIDILCLVYSNASESKNNRLNWTRNMLSSELHNDDP